MAGWVSMGEKVHKQFWWGKLLENGHLEDTETRGENSGNSRNRIYEDVERMEEPNE
jgi:hypothetical protein